MLSLGPIGFAAPWLLLALPALPVLWWLLRVTPPAPKRKIFPATRILRDLRPLEATPARTPWWLLLLRLLMEHAWEPRRGKGRGNGMWCAGPKSREHYVGP